jgi:hypothetical protein
MGKATIPSYSPASTSGKVHFQAAVIHSFHFQRPLNIKTGDRVMILYHLQL